MDQEIKVVDDVKTEAPKEKELVMRKLKGDDLFKLLSLIGKLDIKDEFVTFFAGDDEVKHIELADFKGKKPTKAEQKQLDENIALQEKEAEKLGVRMMANVMQKIMVNASNMKEDINELLADLTDEDIQTIEELGLTAYTKLLIGFFKKEELKDFFISIASLL